MGERGIGQMIGSRPRYCPSGAGESMRVTLDVEAAACSLVTADGRRVVEPGEFDLLVGPTSRDDQLLGARFTIAP